MSDNHDQAEWKFASVRRAEHRCEHCGHIPLVPSKPVDQADKNNHFVVDIRAIG